MVNGNVLRGPVLVLNASYEPINVCAARRALVLMLKGVASSEEHTGSYIHGATRAVLVPSVIRLLEYRRIPRQTRALSRKNILIRDRYTCQYCFEVMGAGELTLDHVTPRSRGGASSWENLVACCRGCNNRKGDRLSRVMGSISQSVVFGAQAGRTGKPSGNKNSCPRGACPILFSA
jgi:5-methylcytosine-specific restriction endonuclease McrA